MDYRKFGESYYIRLDKGDEIINSVLTICKKEDIKSATYSGIGGCSSADIQTFLPEKREFEQNHLEGMLELVSLTGNVVTDENDDTITIHMRYSHIKKAISTIFLQDI